VRERKDGATEDRPMVNSRKNTLGHSKDRHRTTAVAKGIRAVICLTANARRSKRASGSPGGKSK